MEWMRIAVRRVAGLVGRRKRDAELDAEVREHLALATEEKRRQGLSDAEARTAALKEFGGVTQIKEQYRVRRGVPFLEQMARDVRYGWRQLMRSPGFTATAVLTLALGIGANLAVFQLLDSVILAKLPVPHPEDVVEVHAAKSPFDQSWQVSYAAYGRLRASTAGTTPLAARTAFDSGILQVKDGEAHDARFELVSDNYFGVLGVRAAAGRMFIGADANANPAEWPAVVRYDFAREHFSTAEQAVGMHVRLNGLPVVIVGVADRRFTDMVAGYAPDIWLPLEAQAAHLDVAFDSLGPGHGIELERSWLNQPGIFWLMLVARVPAGQRLTVAAHWDEVFRPDRELMTEATADAAAKAAALRTKVELIPAEHYSGWFRRQSSKPLYLLMALSASIFLVGCLNLANLELARLSGRAHELGTRMALGASPWRLIRQVLMENALLVALGGAAAFEVGRTASGVLVHWASGRAWLLNIDLRPHLAVFAVGAGLMVLAMCAFSLLPALYLIRTGLAQASGSRARVAGVAQTGVQRRRANALLAAQVSLSLVLTALSACFAATLVHWEQVDLGLDREHVLSVSVDMRRTGYIEQHHDWTGLYAELQQRLNAVPGVQSTAVQMCPVRNCGWTTALYVYGRSGLSNAQARGNEDHVGPGFFATMGIPLEHGRDFAQTDTNATQAVAIVSRSYARQLFGDESPIGRWVGYEPAPKDHQFLIIGEVADARLEGPQRPAPAMVYMSINQHPFPIHTIEVRAAGDPAQIADRVRAVIHQADSDLPVTEVVPLTTEMNDSLGIERLLARLASVYAGLTVLLVGIGFYGVMSFRTARRRGEFGIRLALGATRRHVRRLVLAQTARILLGGVVPGVLLSAIAIHLVGHLLAGAAPVDVAGVVGACAVLMLAGLSASLIPSWRAGRADPMEALRTE